jgi:hypothetical protein
MSVSEKIAEPVERPQPQPPEPVAPLSGPLDDTHIRRHRLHLRRPLPLWMRVTVMLVGWIVLLIGVAGLVLPGIQGIATIAIGAAILSVVSEVAYKWTRKALQRWPSIWERVERFRGRIHDKLHTWAHGKG